MIYFLAVYLIWIQVALLVFVWRDALLALIAGAVSRGVFVEIIRHFYHRPRPFMVNGIAPLFMENHWSFPSGHAAFMFAVATWVFLKHRGWGIVMYVLAILTGIARVIANVHWPSDIVGGAILGIIVATILYWIGAAGRSRTDMP